MLYEMKCPAPFKILLIYMIFQNTEITFSSRYSKTKFLNDHLYYIL